MSRMRRWLLDVFEPEADETTPAGRVTAEHVKVIGSVATISVTTNLLASQRAFYHWYVDGVWYGVTGSPEWTIYLDTADQVEVKCKPTRYSDWDRARNAPIGYPSRLTLEWRRSTTANVRRYKISYATGAAPPGAWTTIGYVEADAATWNYRYLTPRLDDLTHYWFRIEPVDRYGNVGAALDIGPTYIVRRPTMLTYAATYSDGTQKATFTEV